MPNVRLVKEGQEWGVFPIEGTNYKHIAPCDTTGELLIPHTLDYNCMCDPMISESDSGTLIIHNAITEH